MGLLPADRTWWVCPRNPWAKNAGLFFGGWTTPKNMSSSFGMMTFPIYRKIMKNKTCSKPPTRFLFGCLPKIGGDVCYTALLREASWFGRLERFLPVVQLFLSNTFTSFGLCNPVANKLNLISARSMVSRLQPSVWCLCPTVRRAPMTFHKQRPNLMVENSMWKTHT